MTKSSSTTFASPTIGPDYPARYVAVEAFLSQARERLDLTISVDVYGRLTFPWSARRIDPIGQHLEGMARWAEMVSPMVYPSHYAEREFKDDPYGTVLQALRDSTARTGTPSAPIFRRSRWRSHRG